MNDTASDRLKIVGWLAALLATGIAVNVLAMTKAGASVSDGKEFLRQGHVQHGSLTIVRGGKRYSGHATITLTRKVKPKKKPAKRKRYNLREWVAPAQPVQQWGASDTPRIVAHPPGCPRRAFCGCAAALDVYGRHVRELWLARNWFRFPAAAPAPGMVAVRRSHVFVIREVRRPGLVLAYDGNSGGRKTRIHLRSLAGYTVVNPHGRRYASAQ